MSSTVLNQSQVLPLVSHDYTAPNISEAVDDTEPSKVEVQETGLIAEKKGHLGKRESSLYH